MRSKGAESMRAVLQEDEVQRILKDQFYGSSQRSRPSSTPPALRPKPDHYEVICISLYREDLARLDEKVAELKRRGHRKMSRSALIRFALDSVDISKLPKSY